MPGDELYGDVIARLEEAAPLGYEVAVPSYARADQIGARTLTTLDRMAVDRDRVTVFVADAAERDAYVDALGDAWRVRVACPGLDACRKWYANVHYPAGTRLLNADDDIDGVLAKAGTKLTDWGGTVDHLAVMGFTVAEAVGATLWGVASASNGFYMHDEVVAGLRFVVGSLFGSIAGDAAAMDPREPPRSAGADWLRSIRCYLAHGSVVRVDWLTPKTTYWARGGIRAEVGGKEERAADHTRGLRDVVAQYPALARVHGKGGPVKTLRLKPVTTVRVPRASVEAALHRSAVRS